MTDNTDYAWRSGIDELRVLSDTTFVERSGRMETYFTITHFEPCRLYAFDMQNSQMCIRDSLSTKVVSLKTRSSSIPLRQA